MINQDGLNLYYFINREKVHLMLNPKIIYSIDSETKVLYFILNNFLTPKQNYHPINFYLNLLNMKNSILLLFNFSKL